MELIYIVIVLIYSVTFSVACPPLTDPNNGVMTCSLGDDGVPSYEDTCSFTCNTGYELTGSDTRTCQSDGSWSGSDTMCRRVACPSHTEPDNGAIACSLGDDGVSSYEDTCSFTCNTGYELTGSETRICQSDGSWSGSETLCRRNNLAIIQLQECLYGGMGRGKGTSVKGSKYASIVKV
ncbi:E-selectin-like [Dysidea avara]|uniref:E-selectin-like n=1 Tax=Dysidea avara TaxID=196820 RepID=UPI0033269FC6